MGRPRWIPGSSRFGDGSSTIRQAFHNLVGYATPAKGSPLIDNAAPHFAPADDILGNIRPSKMDVGAFELGATAPPGPGGKPTLSWLFLLTGAAP